MSENTVPEDQLAILKDRLEGHKVFGRLRGKGQKHLTSILDASTSPSDFCKKWDQTSADLRVVGNLVAQLRRDGHDRAAEALLNALASKTYYFPGEVAPLEKTNPLTAVIFNFPKALSLLRWIRAAHWMTLNEYLDVFAGKTLAEKKAKSVDWALTAKLFDDYPSLSKHSRERRARGDYEGWDLKAAHLEDVMAAFPDHETLLEIGSPMIIEPSTYNDHLEIGYNFCQLRFGYLCTADQAEVLSRFTRKEQESISTWMIRVPGVLREKARGMSVVFYPEANHESFRAERPNMVSLGCAGGYGMCLTTSRAYKIIRSLHKGENRGGRQIHLNKPDDSFPFGLLALG